PTHNPLRGKSHREHPAYVIYTSGSTGRPKGVVVRHGELATYLAWARRLYRNEGQAGAPVNTPLSFDATVTSLFVPLLLGWPVHLLPEEDQLEALAELLASGADLALVKLTPAHLEALRGLLGARAASARARLFVVGGEALAASVAAFWRAHVPGLRIVNEYGPTETVVGCCVYELGEEAGQGGDVPIGRPTPNTRLYVLDGALQPVPVGVIGELYIGGTQLGAGYLHQAALTAGCFVADPYGTVPGGRMYRSGDLACWREDGTLSFRGRADAQVKIRGFRIELGEVEAALNSQLGVKHAAALVHDDAMIGQQLLAYVVPAPGTALDTAELRWSLRQTLPAYMVPSSIIALQQLPLTRNGKLDRDALPAPDWHPASHEQPQTPTEEIVCSLFAETLNQGHVGRKDNFFALGGHSLLATKLISRLRAVLGVELQIGTLFEAPTAAELVPHLRQAAATRPPLIAGRRPERLPLSFAQSRLWFIDQLEGASSEYHIPTALRLRGVLDVAALEAAINAIVERHESLRTHFEVIDNEPLQVIALRLQISVPVTDLAQLNEAAQQDVVRTCVQQEWDEPFELASGPVLRVKLLRFGAQDHVLLTTFHHIVSDGWSAEVFTRELGTLYDAFSQGNKNPLLPLPIQYADFALWQRSWLDGAAMDRGLEYWKAQLAGIPAQLTLPTDRPRAPMQTFAADWCVTVIEAEKLARLNQLTQTHHATLYMSLMAAFAALLHRYSGQDDIVVGSPIANRQDAQLEKLIGFFVNSLAIRTRVDPQSSFQALLADVRTTTLNAYLHQDIPFERLVEELSPDRNLNITPVFQVVFALQNMPVQAEHLAGLSIEKILDHEFHVRFDLEVHAIEDGGCLKLYWLYNTDLFDRWRIEQMGRHYMALLDSALAEPNAPLHKLAMLNAQDSEALVKWLDTVAEPRGGATIPALFEAQAMRSPGAVALICADHKMSYGELNAAANKLAHHLIELGVGPETLVGFTVDRSFDMVIALLAILKAGGAYVPLAADLPAHRRERLIADTAIRYAVTAREHYDIYADVVEHIVLMDHRDKTLQHRPGSNPVVTLEAAHPAYVNFTSGSTGKPKGVLVCHAGVVRLVREPNYVHLDGRSRVLHLAPLSFDAATFEIWGALLNGGALVLMQSGRVSVEDIAQEISTRAVNTMWLTAGLFDEMVDVALPALENVRYLLAGGDVVSQDRVRRVMKAHPMCRVVNGYGPTENTTFSCCYPVPADADLDLGVPIGRPINQTGAYVLDAALQLAPVGVIGELYLTGTGLARGYLQEPALTGERFVADPCAREAGARMYRTGDLVKSRFDGTLEFVGRIDDQIKVRGFRIEPGEIETLLRSHESVQDAAVVAQGQGADKQLLGYVIARPDEGEQARAQDAFIEEWHRLYDETYQQDTAEDGDFDLSGWNSSYTGEPLPVDEMHVWVEQTIKQLQRVEPRRVLEVGCGTGLLLTRLAGRCDSYVGLDFSVPVLAKLRRYLDKRPDLRHVQLRHGVASDLTFMADSSVDLVVLNSVVQYFPDVDYLLHVFNEALRVTVPGGHIFVGDVRSLPLLEAYHASVQVWKAPQDLDIHAVRARIEQAQYLDKELVLDPQLFNEVTRRWPQIGRVEIRPKGGRYRNELSRFRYDVMMRLGAKEAVQRPRRSATWTAGGAWREQVSAALARDRTTSVVLSGVPDARVAGSVEIVRQLRGTEQAAPTTVELKTASAVLTGEDPADIWETAQDLGVDVYWQRFESDGVYDVIFNPHWEAVEGSAEIGQSHYRKYARVPDRVGHEALGRELQAYLRQRLPEYMVPVAIMTLDFWPLTRNGKLDRAALPTPGRFERVEEEYVEPSTDTARMLAGLWSKVLGVNIISQNDDFFGLGGHSLLATRLMSHVRDVFGVELPVRAIFDSPQLGQLAEVIEAAEGGSAHLKPPLRPQPRPSRIPLSYAQQRLWFIHELQETSTQYHVPAVLRLSGKLDVNALERALNTIIDRHETLRTRFVNTDGEPEQVIVANLFVPLRVDDLTPLGEGAQQRALNEAMTRYLEEPFDLARGPVTRFGLLKLADLHHVLLATFHHIVADGWSVSVFNRELAALYEAFQEDRTNPLMPLAVQYADFALWQRGWLHGMVMNRGLAYWRAQLAGAPAQLALPTDHPRPPLQTYAAGAYKTTIELQDFDHLRQVSLANQTTLYMTLLAAFALLLECHSGQNDLVIGSPVANRQDVQLEPLLGFFVNVLVMRVQVNPHENFCTLLNHVRHMTLEAYQHQDVPFERLVEELSPERRLDMTPIFQVWFALQNAPQAPQRLPGLNISAVPTDDLRVRFDIELHASERDGAVHLDWLYNRDLFDRPRIERMARHFQQLLGTVLDAPHTPLAQLPLLNDNERRHMLEDLNAAAQPVPQTTLVALLEAQAAATPQAVALSDGRSALSYAELNATANGLAHRLIACGVGPEARVGICLPRSIELVVALLATIKAGGAYVPLDPAYPEARLSTMLADAAPTVVLSNRALRARLAHEAAILLDEVTPPPDAPRHNPTDAERLSPLHPLHPAYVIYTSGSTGQPKGAPNTHQALVNRLLWMQAAYKLTPADHVLQKTPYSFDVSVWEFFWPLITGARLVVAEPEAHRDPARLAETIVREQISTLHFVPSMLSAFIEQAEVGRCTTLRQVICSGEALSGALQRQVLRRLPQVALHNLYGPTEAAIDVTAWTCRREDEAATPPIGRPIWNSRVYVLDRALSPVPVGVAGELYLAGAGLARGYWRQPALSAERFVADPYAPAAGQRMYRTGDLARWRDDGALEYLGRTDHQVKLRGLRIELGEIEATLLADPAVRQAVVLAREDAPGVTRLVAYVVPASGADADAAALRRRLAERLPDYMVPTAFVVLAALPLTPNGKLDRRALPEPQAPERTWRAPATPKEEILCALCADILGVPRVSPDDNFFALGG
ncbi:MAG: amino acid adenylation domain-containing protein, partial [Rhodopila sp.]